MSIFFYFIVYLLLTSSTYCAFSYRINPDYSHYYGKSFAWLAAAGYCTPEQVDHHKCCAKQLKENSWEIVYKTEISIDDISAKILINQKISQVVVTFSGTTSVGQLLTEFLDSLKDFVSINDANEELKLMVYFKRVYDEFLGNNSNGIMDYLKKMITKHKDYQFIFTGHSLGASLATIFSREFSLIHKSEDSPVLISYASPRVGNFAFSNSVMTNVPIVFRIAMEEDPVNKIPFCHLDQKKCLNFFDTLEFMKDIVITEDNINDTYPWHVGGLILYKKDFKSHIICEKTYGENNMNDENCSKLSLYKKSIIEVIEDLKGATLHGYYFVDIQMSKFCSDKSLEINFLNN